MKSLFWTTSGAMLGLFYSGLALPIKIDPRDRRRIEFLTDWTAERT